MGSRGTRSGDAGRAAIGSNASAPVNEPPAPQGPQGPDEVTASLYSEEKARVYGHAEALNNLSAIVGTEMRGDKILELTGAPTGARVDVVANPLTPKVVYLKITHPDFVQERTIKREDGKLVLYNDSFEMKANRGSGIGTRLFAAQAEGAARQGVDRIETFAAGVGKEHPTWSKKESYNGFYTWARLGYNIPIKEPVQKRAERAGFSGVKDTHDLFSRPGGAAWWKEHGEENKGVFDLRAGSTSMQVLEAYKKERGIRLR
jgi:hypothetical protein